MTAAERILWIGGITGSGKTTSARLLARRYGFRWHSSDTRTWNHRDRAIAAGDPVAIEWEALTPVERIALPIDEQRRLQLNRTKMTLDDVAGLPDEPAVVADGTPFTPDLVGSAAIAGRHAVWLFADTDIRAARNRSRGWGGAGGPADQLRAAELTAAVEASGGTVIMTTDHGSVADTVAAIEEACADWLSRQPRAVTTEQRRALIRAGNQAIVGQYRAGLARPWSTTDPASIIRAYDCECARTGCTALIDLRLTDFPDPFGPESPPVLAPGHDLNLESVPAGCW